MRETTLTLWRRADARREWCEAMRDCLVKVAYTRDAAVSVYSWQVRIDRAEEQMRECEAVVLERMRGELDRDPADQWLYDAWN